MADEWASPQAEAKAEELGITLDDVEGTGKEGRATVDDVERAASELNPESDEFEQYVKERDEAIARGESVPPSNAEEVKTVEVEMDTENPYLIYTSAIGAGGEVFVVGEPRTVPKELWDESLKDLRSDPTPEHPEGLPLFRKVS